VVVTDTEAGGVDGSHTSGLGASTKSDPFPDAAGAGSFYPPASYRRL
jgi:hypothetical protein